MSSPSRFLDWHRAYSIALSARHTYRHTTYIHTYILVDVLSFGLSIQPILRAALSNLGTEGLEPILRAHLASMMTQVGLSGRSPLIPFTARLLLLLLLLLLRILLY